MLAAADRIMATEGADAIATLRIAAEAGVSVGSLYRYLPNREAIISSLARQYLGLLEQEMDSLIDRVRTHPVDDLVDAGVETFADFYRSRPGFRALWFSRHLSEETRLLDRAHNSMMAHRIRDLLVAQDIGRSDEAASPASSQTPYPGAPAPCGGGSDQPLPFPHACRHVGAHAIHESYRRG